MLSNDIIESLKSLRNIKGKLFLLVTLHNFPGK